MGELCKGFPTYFQTFLGLSRAMDFTDRPHYEDMKMSFVAVANEEGAKNLWDYQWFNDKTPAPEGLVPLATQTNIRQPEDPEEVRPTKVKKAQFCGCIPMK